MGPVILEITIRGAPLNIVGGSILERMLLGKVQKNDRENDFDLIENHLSKSDFDLIENHFFTNDFDLIENHF